MSELAIENTGQVAEVMIPTGVSDRLQIGADGYARTQFDFRAREEHHRRRPAARHRLP